MAATRTQRVGIWIIAFFMVVGTVGSFAIIVLANDNAQSDQKRYSELSAQYQSEYDAFYKKISDKYAPKLNEYKARVAAFDKDAVTELATEDLSIGTGEALTETSSFVAYYIGWNPKGDIFDSSFNEVGGDLKQPFSVTPGRVIEGWTAGTVGMKEGGARLLTIPSEQAYGEREQVGIPANSPLKFVVLVVPASELEGAPVPSDELNTLYRRVNGF